MDDDFPSSSSVEDFNEQQAYSYGSGEEFVSNSDASSAAPSDEPIEDLPSDEIAAEAVEAARLRRNALYGLVDDVFDDGLTPVKPSKARSTLATTGADFFDVGLEVDLPTAPAPVSDLPELLSAFTDYSAAAFTPAPAAPAALIALWLSAASLSLAATAAGEPTDAAIKGKLAMIENLLMRFPTRNPAASASASASEASQYSEEEMEEQEGEEMEEGEENSSEAGSDTGSEYDYSTTTSPAPALAHYTPTSAVVAALAPSALEAAAVARAAGTGAVWTDLVGAPSGDASAARAALRALEEANRAAAAPDVAEHDVAGANTLAERALRAASQAAGGETRESRGDRRRREAEERRMKAGAARAVPAAAPKPLDKEEADALDLYHSLAAAEAARLSAKAEFYSRGKLGGAVPVLADDTVTEVDGTVRRHADRAVEKNEGLKRHRSKAVKTSRARLRRNYERAAKGWNHLKKIDADKYQGGNITG